MNKRIVHDALILFAFTVVLGLLLGVVYGITKEPIEKVNYEKTQAAYKQVFEDAASFEAYEGFDADAATALVTEQGYADEIEDAQVAKDAGEADWKGNYRYKTPRDNRWGYGLAGGGGIAVLIRQFELNFRVRYYFGYSDIVRARTKNADNTQDGPENPFWASPLRSPLDNLNISVGVSYRFNKAGFDAWNVRRPRREKNEETFNYKLN